jgi:3-mercaptopyruvate sulfurtransferase SseA
VTSRPTSACRRQATGLVNALDPEDYAGRGPVRCGRPGHIPSSVNVSSIAASSAAFVLTLLGVDNVAVYNGSRSEWAADPTLPLVTGEEHGDRP